MRREGVGNLSRELIYAGLAWAWRESHIAASDAVLRLAFHQQRSGDLLPPLKKGAGARR